MASLKESVVELIRAQLGLSNRKITNALHGASAPQQLSIRLAACWRKRVYCREINAPVATGKAM